MLAALLLVALAGITSAWWHERQARVTLEAQRRQQREDETLEATLIAEREQELLRRTIGEGGRSWELDA